MAGDTAGLAQVQVRLDTIERERAMGIDEIVVKRLSALRVAELSGVAAGFEPDSIGPVIGPLYSELIDRLDAAGIAPVGEGTAYYESITDGSVLVHACLPVSAETATEQGFSIVRLPEIDQAATIVHRGNIAGVLATLQTLARWIDASGFHSAGEHRELYIAVGDNPDAWVTEIQESVTRESATSESATSYREADR